MAKVYCDFCPKPMVGYTSQQMFLYCEDHEKEAEAKFDAAMTAMEDEIEATTCMCGDAMKNHANVFESGHTPVSMKAYFESNKGKSE